ncbi:MAG TPA: extradiol ring-cleavage dioxygenase [Xanthobacteraceae bacterium]|nr:extradiol ring-cleavage dioxygenase [Xanthobacteraceae bacterium]
MAQIVAGFGVPHTPIFPHLAKRDGPDCEVARLFRAQKEQLAAARPDLIVMFDTDHLNTFFLDSLPIFAVGVDKNFKAPNDEPRDVPDYVVPSMAGLAAHIRSATIAAGFDVGMTQNYSVDHSVIVPLHFLTPEMHVPVIPFFISGHVPPLPKAERCYALGQTVARAIEAWPEPLRVVVMGSGSFSLEVGGPRMAPGRSDGVPDPDWVMRVIKYLEQQKIDRLIAESTEHQMLKAGNVGGELLNWIAMLGAIGNRKPNYVAPQLQNGHAYGVWRWT